MIKPMHLLGMHKPRRNWCRVSAANVHIRPKVFSSEALVNTSCTCFSVASSLRNVKRHWLASSLLLECWISLMTLSGIRSNPRSFAVISLEFISWRNGCDRSSSTFTQVAVTREPCQQSEKQRAYTWSTSVVYRVLETHHAGLLVLSR